MNVLALDVPADAEHGRIRAELEAIGKTIGPNDLPIASRARAVGATLVTANERKFNRIRGLKVENWLREDLREGSFRTMNSRQFTCRIDCVLVEASSQASGHQVQPVFWPDSLQQRPSLLMYAIQTREEGTLALAWRANNESTYEEIEHPSTVPTLRA